MRGTKLSSPATGSASPGMQARIQVYLQDGTILEGTTALAPPRRKRAGSDAPRQQKDAVVTRPMLDFSTPLRPFMKAHASTLSGAKKLTLLVAYLAKGQVDLPVSRIEVEDRWSKMQALMGGPYNGAYDTRARDQNWISSPQRGSFSLQSGWEAILQ